MPIVQDLVKVVTERSQELIKIVQPHLRQKAGIVSISTAVALTLLYAAFQKVNRPPKSFGNLPYVGYLSFLRYILTNQLVESYSNEMIMPLLKGSNGVYARPLITNWVIQLANPIAVKQLLLASDATFPKAMNNAGVAGTLIHKFIGGPNIALLSGPDWKRHRKVANPAFQRSMPVKAFGELTLKMFKTMKKDINNSNPIDVLQLFERWTLDAIGLTGFDFDFKALEDKDNKWVHNYDSVKGGISNPFYLFFPAFDTKYVHWFKKREALHRNMTEFLKNLDDIIEQKRKLVSERKNTESGSEDRDLLTLMIESEMDGSDGAYLSNEELRSNLCIFFLAGHDTTANSLSFALYEMAMNPEIQEKAREEAIRVLGNSSDDVIPTIEQTKQLSYIDMIMKETLRRHPPVYGISSRVVTKDMEFGGNFVPKGSQVSVDIYNLHHNPEVWNDPYKFKPERFEAKGEADQQEGIAWAPFSNGSRQCIGMNFSLTEQRVVLSMMLRKYTWSISNDSPHIDKLQMKGLGFGLVIVDEELQLSFKERH